MVFFTLGAVCNPFRVQADPLHVKVLVMNKDSCYTLICYPIFLERKCIHLFLCSDSMFLSPSLKELS